jgi:hypothetical protein
VLLFAPILLVVWIAIFAAHGLHDRAASRRNVGNLLGAMLWGAGLLTFGSVVYPHVNIQLGETLLTATIVFLACGRLRALYERGADSIYRRGLGRIPTLVVGKEENRKRVLDAMEKSRALTPARGSWTSSATGGANLAPLREAPRPHAGARRDPGRSREAGRHRVPRPAALDAPAQGSG